MQIKRLIGLTTLHFLQSFGADPLKMEQNLWVMLRAIGVDVGGSIPCPVWDSGSLPEFFFNLCAKRFNLIFGDHL